MKILICGGLGYVGSALVHHLIYETDYQLRILDLNLYNTATDFLNYFNMPERFELIIDDLRTCDLDPILAGVDYVVNLASLVGEPVCKMYPEHAREINCDAAIRLAEKCQEKNIKRYIFASTCSNYGINSDGSAFDEEGELKPLSIYSEHKVAVEEKLLHKYSNLKATILRFATAFGISSGIRFDLMVHEFIKDALKDHQIILFGAQAFRPFVHIMDMARAIHLIIESDHELEDKCVYNVGSNQNNYKKIDLANLVKKYIDCEIICLDKKQKSDPRDYQVNFDKIHQELGFFVKYNISDDIDNIINLWRSNLLNDYILTRNINNRDIPLLK